MIFRFLYALFLIAFMGLNQPASAAANGAKVQPKTLADAQIERAIKNKLAKSKLNADHFTVTVTNGTATIEGSTNVMQHKGVMTRLARLSGATTVHNNIRISEAAKAKAIAGLGGNRTSGQAPHAAAQSASTGPAEAAPIPRATVLPAR